MLWTLCSLFFLSPNIGHYMYDTFWLVLGKGSAEQPEAELSVKR